MCRSAAAKTCGEQSGSSTTHGRRTAVTMRTRHETDVIWYMCTYGACAACGKGNKSARDSSLGVLVDRSGLWGYKCMVHGGHGSSYHSNIRSDLARSPLIVTPHHAHGNSHVAMTHAAMIHAALIHAAMIHAAIRHCGMTRTCTRRRTSAGSFSTRRAAASAEFLSARQQSRASTPSASLSTTALWAKRMLTESAHPLRHAYLQDSARQPHHTTPFGYEYGWKK